MRSPRVAFVELISVISIYIMRRRPARAENAWITSCWRSRPATARAGDRARRRSRSATDGSGSGRPRSTARSRTSSIAAGSRSRRATGACRRERAPALLPHHAGRTRAMSRPKRSGSPASCGSHARAIKPRTGETLVTPSRAAPHLPGAAAPRAAAAARRHADEMEALFLDALADAAARHGGRRLDRSGLRPPRARACAHVFRRRAIGSRHS